MKELIIDLESVEISEISDKISLSDFLCLGNSYLNNPTALPTSAENLEHNGYIKIISDTEFILLEKGIRLFGKKSNSLMELAGQIRELFPSGVRSGGYLVRSSEADIADKLRKFFKKHKYTQEEVIAATSKYIDVKRRDGYKYIQRAIYFIEKDGVSTLASECAGLKGVQPDNLFDKEA